MGNPLTFNMIVLGAFLKAKPVIKLENVKKGLEKSLPERHHKLIPLNLAAIEIGQENLADKSNVQLQLNRQGYIRIRYLFYQKLTFLTYLYVLVDPLYYPSS